MADSKFTALDVAGKMLSDMMAGQDITEENIMRLPNSGKSLTTITQVPYCHSLFDFSCHEYLTVVYLVLLLTAPIHHNSRTCFN